MVRRIDSMPASRWGRESDLSMMLRVLLIVGLAAVCISLFGKWGIVSVGVVAFFRLPLSVKTTLFAVSVLFPLGPGTALGGFEILFFHLLVPLLFVNFAAQRIPVGFRRYRPIAVINGFGVAMLLAGLFISYVRNPVLARSLGGAAGMGYGLKSYVTAILCIATYYMSYSMGRNGLVRAGPFIRWLLVAALLIGFLRILSYLDLLQVPFFRGSLMYLGLEEGVTEFTERARRIGGMDLTSGIIVMASFALWDRKRSRLLALAGLIGGISMMILGGGRAAFIGLSVALLIGIARRGMKVLIRVFVVLVLVYAIMTSLTLGGSRSVLESQQQRIFMYEAVFERQTQRLEGYQVLLDAWRENPLFGKGISPTGEEGGATIGEVGGHGAYFSLVGLFGLFGLLFILCGMAYPLYRGIRSILVPERAPPDPDEVVLTRFLVLFMVFLAVIFGVGGNGYSAPNLFLVTGMLVAMLERRDARESAGRRQEEAG